MSAIEEAGGCPEQCGGHLHYPKVEDCSCHISPPCAACTDVCLTCGFCGWREPLVPVRASETAVSTPWWDRPKPSHDLGNGKRIFDYGYDSRSGSTMVYRGRYEGEVTAADIIALLGDGTFGHRGPALSNGHFAYTKITD